MALPVDGGVVLYAVGVALGVAALAYFARDLFASLSITVKTALLFEACLALFVLGSAVADRLLGVVAYALGGGAYLVFLRYALGNHDLGEAGVFGALAGSSGLFLLLGYVGQSNGLALPPGAAVGSLVLLAAVAVGLVVVDRRTGDVATSVDLVSTVTFDERRVTIGTVTLSNPSPFRRHVSLSRPDAHASLDGRDVHRPLSLAAPGDSRATPDALAGHATATRDLRFALGPHAEETDDWRGATLRVVRADGRPKTIDSDTIAVVVR